MGSRVPSKGRRPCELAEGTGGVSEAELRLLGSGSSEEHNLPTEGKKARPSHLSRPKETTGQDAINTFTSTSFSMVLKSICKSRSN